MRRLVSLLAAVGMVAGLGVSVQPAVAAPSYLTVSGNVLTYNGQTVTLRGENFNNEPALACCGGPDITKINANNADYAKASSFGENAIRFGMDWNWYNASPTTFFSVVDQHMAWATANHVWMVPVIYEGPGASFGGFCCQDNFWNSASNQTTLTNFWSAFATHYANEPILAGYDIMNEPQDPLNNLTRYQAWAQTTYNAITAADPNHFIVLEAMGNPNDMPAITGSKILGSNHCYHAVGTDGCNYPGPNTQAPPFLPWLSGEIGDTFANGTTYVPGDLANFNANGISWMHFVMHETTAAGTVYGLYQNWNAGDFSSPYTAMINAVTSAAAGAIKPGGGSPSNDFSISASPSSLSVMQGSSGTSTISTAVVSGTAETVSLSASGAPTGVTTGFNPTSVTAGNSSTLTLTVATSTVAGTYPITLTGTAPSATHNTTVTLTVTAAPPPANISVTQQAIPVVVPPGSLSITATLQNTGTASISLPEVVVAGRPPGGTNGGGPFDDFADVYNVTIGAGQSYTITGSRSFTVGDPTGTWYSFLTHRTSDNVWHDGADTGFAVGAAAGAVPTGGSGGSANISVTQQAIVVVTRPTSLSMTGTLQNTGGTSITLAEVVLAGRPPGGTNSGGPFDDFADVFNIILGAGQSYTITGSRTFPATDPVGTWRSYLTYRTADNVWHDGTNANFIVR